jgi:hypothetical protein
MKLGPYKDEEETRPAGSVFLCSSYVDALTKTGAHGWSRSFISWQLGLCCSVLGCSPSPSCWHEYACSAETILCSFWRNESVAITATDWWLLDRETLGRCMKAANCTTWRWSTVLFRSFSCRVPSTVISEVRTTTLVEGLLVLCYLCAQGRPSRVAYLLPALHPEETR